MSDDPDPNSIISPNALFVKREADKWTIFWKEGDSVSKKEIPVLELSYSLTNIEKLTGFNYYEIHSLILDRRGFVFERDKSGEIVLAAESDNFNAYLYNDSENLYIKALYGDKFIALCKEIDQLKVSEDASVALQSLKIVLGMSNSQDAVSANYLDVLFAQKEIREMLQDFIVGIEIPVHIKTKDTNDRYKALENVLISLQNEFRDNRKRHSAYEKVSGLTTGVLSASFATTASSSVAPIAFSSPPEVVRMEGVALDTAVSASPNKNPLPKQM